MNKPLILIKMKIPETTKENPYIEFRFHKDGQLTLHTTSNWWGGKNDGFYSSDGYEGNTCLPKDLNKYISAFVSRKIKDVDKEILKLQNKRNKMKKEDLVVHHMGLPTDNKIENLCWVDPNKRITVKDKPKNKKNGTKG